MAELRLESGILGICGPVGLLFSLRRHPIYGGFAFLVFPLWVLGDDVIRPWNVPLCPTRLYWVDFPRIVFTWSYLLRI